MSRFSSVVGLGRNPAVVRTRDKGPMSWYFSPGSAVFYSLLYVRVHFLSGAATVAPLTITLDSAAGDEYDVLLYTSDDCGMTSDLHLQIVDRGNSSGGPSPWSFQPGDKLLFVWDGPADVLWGIEVGFEAT